MDNKPDNKQKGECQDFLDGKENVNFDFQDQDIVPIFRLFADISGCNLFIHPEIKGRATMKFRDVPWSQALDKILQTFDLDMSIEENVIRIAPIYVFAKEAEYKAKLEAVKIYSLPLETKLFTLDHADINTVESVIKGARILSPRGSINLDRRTNSIIVKDVPLVFDEIVSIVTMLDVPQKPYDFSEVDEGTMLFRNTNFAKNKKIFLAHQFKEETLIKKMKILIEEYGYDWEEGKRIDLGSISEDILTKIQDCGFVLVLMTKKDLLENGEFTTSSWLIEEKGAALAFGHRPLIMVETGVARHYVGFLQSDDEMIYFDRSNCDAKITDALIKIDSTYKKRLEHTTKELKNMLINEVVSDTNNNLFYIDLDGLHPLPDEKTAFFLKSAKGIMPLSEAEITKYTLSDKFSSVCDKSTPIIKNQKGTVYIILNNKKYYINSYSWLDEWDRDHSDIKIVSNEETKRYPMGR